MEPTVLQAALAKAITDAITPEMQKEIFQKALQEHLFHEDERHKSHVREEFDRALRQCTSAVAERVVHEPENLAKIRHVMQQALDAAFDNPEFVRNLTDKIVKGLRSW